MHTPNLDGNVRLESWVDSRFGCLVLWTVWFLAGQGCFVGEWIGEDVKGVDGCGRGSCDTYIEHEGLWSVCVAGAIIRRITEWINKGCQVDPGGERPPACPS